MSMTYRLTIALALAFTSILASARADEDLAAAARDPTAPVTQLQVRADHVSGYHNLPGADQTRFVLQPVIPFNVGERPHIARITVPYVAAGPDWAGLSATDTDATAVALPPNFVPTEDQTGLGDTSIFDFMMFDSPWYQGRLALGVSAILPTATDPALGSEKWSLGPAAGTVARLGDLTLGAIALANFSVAGKSDRDEVSALTIQPIGSYGLSNGWSLELSEISYNYDFKQGKWSTVPLGGRVAKLVQFGERSVRFYVDAEYNFADSAVAPEWTYRFAVVPLL